MAVTCRPQAAEPQPGVAALPVNRQYNNGFDIGSPVAHVDLRPQLAYRDIKSLDHFDKKSAEPQPAYGFEIESPYTFDEKSHQESADNGVRPTSGRFCVPQPDGVERCHEYIVTADDGFDVRVTNEKRGYYFHNVATAARK